MDLGFVSSMHVAVPSLRGMRLVYRPLHEQVSYPLRTDRSSTSLDAVRYQHGYGNYLRVASMVRQAMSSQSLCSVLRRASLAGCLCAAQFSWSLNRRASGLLYILNKLMLPVSLWVTHTLLSLRFLHWCQRRCKHLLQTVARHNCSLQL